MNLINLANPCSKNYYYFFFFQIIMFHQSCCQISRLFYLHVSAVDEITGHWQVARSGSVDGGFCLWATIREPHCTSCKGNFMKTFTYESGICKGLQEHVTSTCKMMERLNVILRSMWKKKKIVKTLPRKGQKGKLQPFHNFAWDDLTGNKPWALCVHSFGDWWRAHPFPAHAF